MRFNECTSSEIVCIKSQPTNFAPPAKMINLNNCFFQRQHVWQTRHKFHHNYYRNSIDVSAFYLLFLFSQIYKFI